tara:strand:+ start:138 stop:1634 length:1497 start_codon:yes stop_codon:yes gene_type:complete
MSTVERNILTVIEPTIELDELEMTDVESGTENSDGDTIKEKPSKFSTMIPLIKINSYEVQGDRLETFELKSVGFYPTCKFSFFDVDAMFTARFFPKDGDIIQLYIRSQGEETTFKPIRIDFTIEKITPLGGGGASDEASQIMVDGRMHVPNLFTEKVQFQDNTSWNSLLAIAEELKLGYASNVEDTTDQQIWTNPYDTAQRFIEDITSNSYMNDESFFTAYIDPYYYLTFVDANKFFGMEDDLETSQMFSQNAIDTMGTGDDADSEFNFPNMLSNNLSLQGSARYISKYQQVNNSGKISKNNGYKRYTQYWDLNAKEFISEFVDPITSDTPGMVPVTKGRTINGEVEGPVNDQVKFKFLGTQGDNVHDNYYYASIQNFQNLAEINKLGMTIELDTVNPGILRYSRIYCSIMETAQMVKGTLTSPENDENAPSDSVRRTETPDNLGSDVDNEFGVINEYLSGFYVITGIEYFLISGEEAGGAGLKQRLHLRRREVTPST